MIVDRISCTDKRIAFRRFACRRIRAVLGDRDNLFVEIAGRRIVSIVICDAAENQEPKQTNTVVYRLDRR